MNFQSGYKSFFRFAQQTRTHKKAFNQFSKQPNMMFKSQMNYLPISQYSAMYSIIQQRNIIQKNQLLASNLNLTNDLLIGIQKSEEIRQDEPENDVDPVEADMEEDNVLLMTSLAKPKMKALKMKNNNN